MISGNLLDLCGLNSSQTPVVKTATGHSSVGLTEHTTPRINLRAVQLWIPLSLSRSSGSRHHSPFFTAPQILHSPIPIFFLFNGVVSKATVTRHIRNHLTPRWTQRKYGPQSLVYSYTPTKSVQHPSCDTSPPEVSRGIAEFRDRWNPPSQ